MIETLLGQSTTIGSVLWLLLILGATWLMGQALATTWRSALLVAWYGVLLGLGDRFFIWGLFEGALLSATGWLLDTALIVAVALVAFRVTRVAKLCSQYPWLYRRAGLWRAAQIGEDGRP